MNIIKTEKQRNILSELKGYKYNPNKRIQYCWTHQDKESYIEDIMKEFKTLGNCMMAMLTTPFIVLAQAYYTFKSLFPYSLVITKKELIKENIYE